MTTDREAPLTGEPQPVDKSTTGRSLGLFALHRKVGNHGRFSGEQECGTYLDPCEHDPEKTWDWVCATCRDYTGDAEEWPCDTYALLIERDEALRVVCEVAFQWAGEYGFAIPERATEVWDAAKLLRPDLEPTDDD